MKYKINHTNNDKNFHRFSKERNLNISKTKNIKDI